MNANYTLLDILTNNVKVLNKESGKVELLTISNGIEIPMIQRDYAQGRTDDRTKFIRAKFLKDIHDVLKENQEGNSKILNLDFIYGYIENESFIPLDGQQRLTTLYIIHWFLAFKEDNIDFKTFGLHLFSYKTRQSAKEFLKSLNVEANQEKIKKECNNDFEILTKSIKNQPWYNLKWNDDPSVKGFLQTLQDVVSLFSDISFATLEQNRPICFHFLKIDEFGLGDNLYIKMNARGKSLSDFENFKASFESIISKNKTVAEDFIKKIDGIWLDAFWNYALKTLPNLEVNENVENLTKKCDYLILEFIKKSTEYLFFKDNHGKTFEFTDINVEKVYTSAENIILLTQLFDIITALSFDDFILYFKEIFSKKHKKNRIATFRSDKESELNFIFKIFNGEDFSHFENMLFFGWLNFILRKNSTEINDDLKDFLRIIRNYVNNINQKNKTNLDTELRTEYYTDIIETIKEINVTNPYSSLAEGEFLSRSKYINYEINKYDIFKDDALKKELLFKIEDHGTLRGLIFNFDFSNYSTTEIENIVLNYYSMFEECSYQDIIRLLLCFGDYSVRVGYSNLGEFKFFGQKGKWHRVLASPDNEIQTNFKVLFSIFSKEVILDWHNFIESSVVLNSAQYKNTWLWYCMQPKYKFILYHPIFTKNNENRIEIFYNQSLNSYHHNPFIYWFRYHSAPELQALLNLNESCAQYTNYSRLHLKNGVQLEQINSNWHVFNLNRDCKNELFVYDEEKDCHIFECVNLIDDLSIQLHTLHSNKEISISYDQPN